MTRDRNVLITAYSADCVPVSYYDPVSAWIYIIHAGWRSIARGIAGEIAKGLMKEGVNIHRLFITIDPSIGFARYQVNQDIID
ncbi:laccase domain-containing protein [Amphibacillus sp. MSJ-3]|nr:laccase domain-containing protein [Amphibacillus sp. MSJ-3]